MASASFNDTDADELTQYQYQLFKAAENGDLELFQLMATLLDGGRGRLREVVQAAMAQDSESWSGMGALHIAASHGRLEVCRYLIEELRLDVDDADQGGSTPLMAAILYNHISIANYLLYHGADVNKAGPDGSTPLHCTASLGDCGMVQQLLAKGASVDPVGYFGTPLHVAAINGRDGVMKILLDHGADFNKVVDGETPLDAAKSAGNMECVNLLIEVSVCRHYNNQEATDMKNNWIQILSSGTAASCEQCWKDPPTKQQGARSKEKKKKNKGGATKEQAKVERSHVWACLVCGQHYCGGANAKPRGHAEAHCCRNKHWWMANHDDPVTVYCFKCRKDFLLNLSNASSPPKKERAKYKQKETTMMSMEKPENNLGLSRPITTGEVSQLTDISMQPQTGAPVIESPLPPPQVQIKPWEFQRDPNRNKRRSNAMIQVDDIVAQNIGVFLDGFTLPGDKKPYYHCEVITMVERGSGSRELNVIYPHLLRYSKNLALQVCNRYERLKVHLKETARLFVQKLLTAESNLTDPTREHMQELATVGSAQCLELKFLEMPKTHKLLKDCLKPPLTKPMEVFGHKGQPIMIPLPNKCALIQRLISVVLSKHRAGLSWEGELTLDDIEIYDDKVIITKIPKSFPIEPQISKEMIVAMEKDFNTIAQTIVEKFQSPMTSIPYFSSFYGMLSCMSKYAVWWSNGVDAEALRELIEHHPFLKSSMARSNLLSGIFNAFRSYDTGDHTVLFKKILEDTVNSISWVTKTRSAENIMVRTVFIRKDKTKRKKRGQMAPGPNPGIGTATTETTTPADPNPGTRITTTEATATTDAAGTKPAIDPTTESVRTADAAGTEATTTADATNPKTEVPGYYEEIMESLIEYLRHLSQHGSERSFDRPFSEQQSHPRKQHMKSLDETEVAGAILLETEFMYALTKLIGSSAMIGMLESVWKCYKSSNSSFQA